MEDNIKKRVIMNGLSDALLAINDLTENKCKIPLVVWGEAGIGKTLSIKSWAENNGFDFVITPGAQIQEVGDLQGMPIVEKVMEKVVYDNILNSYSKYNSQEEYDFERYSLREVEKTITNYARPDILPPYDNVNRIWLIDDFNRCNNLIMQSFLHLLQFREFGGNKIGENTYIIMTGNPEDGEYQVRDTDKAFKTRTLNIEVRFDVVLWGSWAAKNKEITEEQIKFVTEYPEVLVNNNNIRTWTNGFQSGSDLLLKLSVGNDAYYTYESFMKSDTAFKSFNVKDIFQGGEKAENIKKLIFNNRSRNDIKMLMLSRIAMIDIDILSKNDSTSFENLIKFVTDISEMEYEDGDHMTRLVTDDELLFPLLYWKTFYKNALKTGSKELFRKSMSGII